MTPWVALGPRQSLYAIMSAVCAGGRWTLRRCYDLHRSAVCLIRFGVLQHLRQHCAGGAVQCFTECRSVVISDNWTSAWIRKLPPKTFFYCQLILHNISYCSVSAILPQSGTCLWPVLDGLCVLTRTSRAPFTYYTHAHEQQRCLCRNGRRVTCPDISTDGVCRCGHRRGSTARAAS
jgi:hypothetical protein